MNIFARRGFALVIYSIFCMKLVAEPNDHRTRTPPTLSETTQIADPSCAALTMKTYADIHAELKALSAYIDRNRNGAWKGLRNFVLPQLKALDVPSFQNSKDQSTKISHYQTRGLTLNHRILNFESSSAFGKSRWSLSNAEAESLCAGELKNEYQIPAWSGSRKEAKRIVQAQFSLQADLTDMKLAIEKIRKDHTSSKSPDHGHKYAYRSLSEMLRIIEKLQQMPVAQKN